MYPRRPAVHEETGAVADGWSNSEVTNIGSGGLVHGPWGNDETRVERSIRIPAGVSNCEVSWRSWAIDSRDNEVDRVLIDGTEVWSASSNCAFSTVGDMGDWVRGPRDFPNPWAGERDQDVCMADVTVTVPCSGSMTLRFESGVDQQESDEAWAFSDVTVIPRTALTPE